MTIIKECIMLMMIEFKLVFRLIQETKKEHNSITIYHKMKKDNSLRLPEIQHLVAVQLSLTVSLVKVPQQVFVLGTTINVAKTCKLKLNNGTKLTSVAKIPQVFVKLLKRMKLSLNTLKTFNQVKQELINGFHQIISVIITLI